MGGVESSLVKRTLNVLLGLTPSLRPDANPVADSVNKSTRNSQNSVIRVPYGHTSAMFQLYQNLVRASREDNTPP